MRRVRSPRIGVMAGMLLLAACATEPPRAGPVTLQLGEGLTLILSGSVGSVTGELTRRGGFGRATLELQSSPRLQIDVVAHWRSADGRQLPNGPADNRRIVTGPAGVAVLEFIAPSPEGSTLLVEMAPSDRATTFPSQF